MVLTGSQAKAIQNNWKQVRSRAQDFGNDLFIRYLAANPGDQDHFPKFCEVPMGDLRGDKEFNHQTKLVIDALGNIVDHLDEIQKAANFLRAKARTHYKRDVTMPQFERLLDMLPMFLQEKAHADGAVADAWRIAIADLMPAMRDEFARAHE